MAARKPILHGRDHKPGGADPIPDLFGLSGGKTYPVLIEENPATQHYWPASDLTGNLKDTVGTWDLTPAFADVSGVTWPQYLKEGPIPEPNLAVENAGVQGIPAGDNGRFARTDTGSSMFTAGQTWSIVVWAYPVTYTLSFLLFIGTEATSISVSWQTNTLHAAAGPVTVAETAPFELDAWHLVGLRYDGATLDLLRDDAGVVASAADTGGVTVIDQVSWLNYLVGPAWYPFNGRTAQMAFFTGAITDEYFHALYTTQDTTGLPPDGWVMTTDGTGKTAWKPPTVEWEDV